MDAAFSFVHSDHTWVNTGAYDYCTEDIGCLPERDYLFEDASRSKVHVWPYDHYMGAGNHFYQPTALWYYNTDKYRSMYLGMHGADRNGNGRFDQGPTPRSVRMRAVNVARFDFYDRRIYSSFRQ
jgi:hypothetical protein